MLTPEQLLHYCLSKPRAALEFPFGEIPAVVKVGGRIFAEIYPKPDNYKITLKCDPILAQALRHQYPGVVVRGYHCPASMQPYRNTIYVEHFDDEKLKEMIDHSYQEVVRGMSRKMRREIEG